MKNFYNENKTNEFYRKIANEIWKINPYIDLNFPAFPNIWLTVKAHIFYKGEPFTVTVHIADNQDCSTEFIIALAQHLMERIDRVISKREGNSNVND